jgi:hypothetical protein
MGVNFTTKKDNTHSIASLLLQVDWCLSAAQTGFHLGISSWRGGGGGGEAHGLHGCKATARGRVWEEDVPPATRSARPKV